MATNNATNNFGGALTLIQSQTATSDTSVEFTSGISGAYSNYLLIADNIIDSSFAVSDTILVQLSTDGGGTWISTGYVNGATITSTTGIAAGLEASTTSVCSFTLNMYNLTTGTGYITSSTALDVFDAPSTILTAVNSGAYDTANTLVNAIRVVLDSGNAFDGKISLYGYSV